MTKFMFQTGQFKFKPHLRGDLLDDLQDVAAEADYFTISPDKLEMNDIAFNWQSGDVNKNLVKIMKKLRRHSVRLTGQFLVVIKGSNGKMALYKYLPKYCSVRAVRGYFRIVRVYPLNGSRKLNHPHNYVVLSP